ncbi:MAG: PepSY domain-containing protein [Nocardioidaceae bacterium]
MAKFESMRYANRASRLLGLLACGVIFGVTVAGCGGGESSSTRGSATASHAPSTSTSTSGDVSKKQAAEIATGRYGGKIINVESDTEHGQPTWEVEIRGSRQGRIEVAIQPGPAGGSAGLVEAGTACRLDH